MQKRLIRQFAVFLVSMLLIINATFLVGCSDKTKATLDRVGSVSKILARGYNDQIAALKAGNADPAKIAVAERWGRTLTTTTDALDTFLAGLKDVDETNVAEVTQKIGAALGIVNQILLNPDIQAIDANSKFAQILGWASTGFTVATTTLAALFPKKPAGEASFSSIGSTVKSIPSNKIELNLPPPPPAVAELLKKG